MRKISEESRKAIARNTHLMIIILAAVTIRIMTVAGMTMKILFKFSEEKDIHRPSDDWSSLTTKFKRN